MANLVKLLGAFLVFLCCLGAARPANAGFAQTAESLSARFARGNEILIQQTIPQLVAQTRAGLADAWQGTICLFGFCETKKQIPNPELQTPNNTQTQTQNTQTQNNNIGGNQKESGKTLATDTGANYQKGPTLLK